MGLHRDDIGSYKEERGTLKWTLGRPHRGLVEGCFYSRQTDQL